MAVVDVRADRDWSDADTNYSEMVSGFCRVSASLLTECTRLLKLEAVSKFMIFLGLQLGSIVFSGLDCPDFCVEPCNCILLKGRA